MTCTSWLQDSYQTHPGALVVLELHPLVGLCTFHMANSITSSPLVLIQVYCETMTANSYTAEKWRVKVKIKHCKLQWLSYLTLLPTIDQS